MVRVGVIGVGYWGEKHLRVYKELGVEVVFISDINEERLLSIARKYEVPHFSKDFRECVKYGIDAASVVVPTHQHYEVAKYLIKSGVNILLEKPATGSSLKARELMELAERAGVKVMVGFIERFNPVVQALKHVIEARNYGDLISLTTFRVGPYPPNRVGDDVVRDLGTHDIDTLRFLLGSEVCEVHGFAEGRGYSPIDIASLTLKFCNGVIATVNINWLVSRRFRELVAIFNNGVIKLDYIAKKLTIISDKVEERVYNGREPLKDEIKSFINSLLSKGEVRPSLSDAINVLKVVDIIEGIVGKRRNLTSPEHRTL